MARRSQNRKGRKLPSQSESMPSTSMHLIKATFLALTLLHDDASAAIRRSEGSPRHERQDLETTMSSIVGEDSYFSWFLDPNQSESVRYDENRELLQREMEASTIKKSTTTKKKKKKKRQSTKQCIEAVLEQSTSRDFRKAANSDKEEVLDVRKLNEVHGIESAGIADDVDAYLDLIYNKFFRDGVKEGEEQHHVEEFQLDDTSYNPEHAINELSNSRSLKFSEDIQRKVS